MVKPVNRYLVGLVLLILMPLLTACTLGPLSIWIKYEAKGVCEHVLLTSNRDTVGSISYIPVKEQRDGRTSLPVGVAQRIPAFNPAPNSTWYSLLGPPPPRFSSVPVDLTWQCEPGRSPVTYQFAYSHGAFDSKRGLTITEDAGLPSGLRIEVTDFPQ